MNRAVDLLHYCTKRASTNSDDIRKGAREAIGVAYELFWAPVTVPKAVIAYGLSLSPVRCLVLVPLHLLQRHTSGGKVINFTLLDASGSTAAIQPVWAGWDYDVAGLLDLLEKHLQLQKKEVWVEGLGIVHKGLLKDSYTMLPLASTMKEFALPLSHLVAMVESRPSATVDAMLSTNAPLRLEKSPDASPEKPSGASKEFFILPADSRFGQGSLLLASHPLPANLSDGTPSDADSPVHSPLSNPEKPHFSPFK